MCDITIIKYIFYLYINKKGSIVRNNFIFTDKNYLTKVINYLYLDINTQLKMLSDITAIDNVNKPKRFTLVYNLLSILYNIRMFIYVPLGYFESIITLTSIYPCANWYEREVWDLFGILFIHHNDLRRILTDYGFIGFPLRKDYPLSGYKEIYYDFFVETLLYKNIKLNQKFRLFKLK